MQGILFDSFIKEKPFSEKIPTPLFQK